MTRQTVAIPHPEQPNVPQIVSEPQNAQGSTSVDPMDVTATPMETLLKRFQSFKPPMLKGTENSVDCENWLEDIEQLFESLDYSDDRRIRMVVHQLHEVSKSWWITTKKSLEYRVSYRKYKGEKFASLKQGQLNIKDYVAKFSSLLKFSPHIAASDEAMMDQFINGLNPDVFTLVNSGRPNTFASALNKAKGAEAGLLRQRGAPFIPQPSPQLVPLPLPQNPPPFQQPSIIFEGGSSGRKDSIFRPKGKKFKKEDSSSSSSGRPRQFGSSQSYAFPRVYCSKCWGRHAPNQCKGVSGSCNICHQTGHYAKACPQRATGASASRSVPQTLRIEKLYAKLSKYEFWPDRVVFLGHIISGDGISVDPSKVEAVINWLRPTSVPEIWIFMGLTGYYHRFIRDFFSNSKPITQLTQKNMPYVWTEACEASFLELKKRLTSAPVLTIPLGTDAFVVYCDASHRGRAPSSALKSIYEFTDPAHAQMYCTQPLPVQFAAQYKTLMPASTVVLLEAIAQLHTENLKPLYNVGATVTTSYVVLGAQKIQSQFQTSGKQALQGNV
ncbi:uncharacterized protein [Henckelia pumila]|uniref:uncharacterized protein n=1 Tax=Henckelia pumila TaxID=405737 RepID=UPI003C6DDA74